MDPKASVLPTTPQRLTTTTQRLTVVTLLPLPARSTLSLLLSLVSRKQESGVWRYFTYDHSRSFEIRSLFEIFFFQFSDLAQPI